jgi:hypothetical protein
MNDLNTYLKSFLVLCRMFFFAFRIAQSGAGLVTKSLVELCYQKNLYLQGYGKITHKIHKTHSINF